jgi:NADH:ubiquinone oxidoreductase subunit 4 (subunit M)
MIFMFMVKFPVFIMHGWLPRAHVEAPTLGSVLLARILLKLGSYGLLRLLVFCFSKFAQSTLAFSLFGALIAGVVCFLQRDCKAFIAMSRVSHIRAL